MRRIVLVAAVLFTWIGANADTLHVPGQYPTIQAAINAAQHFDIIVVAPGTYQENINFIAKLVTVTSIAPDDPQIVATTIIDGGEADTVVTFTGIEGPDAVLAGLTITRGLAPYGGGGGIHGHGATPTISKCTITGNAAVGSGQQERGGGLYECDGTIDSCTISENTARYGGGLAYCDGTIVNCTITENTTTGTLNGGGGLFSCDGVVANCMVTGNDAYVGGAFGSCDARIINCTISGNTAYGGGGLNACDGTLANCTITGNLASSSGGGLSISHGTIVNCVIWDNRPDQLYSSSVPTFSCIQGGGGGKGSIQENPLFMVPGYWDWAAGGVWVEGNYRLLSISPAINTGDPNYVPQPGETDLDGHARILCGRVDMGAYEFGIGDFDCNRTVDLIDYASWPGCMTGPGGGPYGAGCEAFDFEYDTDVDLVDFGEFQGVIAGP